MKGLIVAAPSSSSGKTVFTLGLIRALARSGIGVGAVKVGPDYIDPAFHAAAGGGACRNLDLWAMRPETAFAQVARAGAGAEIVVAEGVMGLFDGASDGSGSTADVAAWLGWPVVLVVDAGRQGQSVAALAAGFANHREDVTVAGVVLNRVGSDSHRRILDDALGQVGIPVLGAIPRDPALELPSRHLGLVQAGERDDLDAWIERAAEILAANADIGALRDLAAAARAHAAPAGPPLPPLGARIAIARDAAFAFAYAHVLDGWREAGAELAFFSPLAGEVPDNDADAVFLPGGYPELFAAEIAANRAFLDGLRAAARRGAQIYGECGGFMVLGRALIDATGARHEMAGLLPVETSFAERRMTLGYRDLALVADGPLGPAGARFRGHEFHYSTEISGEAADPLFEVANAVGAAHPPAGCRTGTVAGSYIHLIDSA